MGIIYDKSNSVVGYRIQSIRELEILISIFDKYPLKTEKWADFQLFKNAFEIIKDKKHTTKEGIEELFLIKASMNTSLKNEQNLKIIEKKRPQRNLENLNISDLNWISGFVEGEGCFSISIIKSKLREVNEAVLCRFIITQHIRDLNILKKIQEIFECGRIEINNKGYAFFVISSFKDITEKLIPFFNKYPLIGDKNKSLEDFVTVVELMKENKHLTKNGLEKIKQIKAGMNKGRKIDK